MGGAEQDEIAFDYRDAYQRKGIKAGGDQGQCGFFRDQKY